jgi:DAACS family dicarboxylate/amino acid:cation (Na+ or H+) symporter
MSSPSEGKGIPLHTKVFIGLVLGAIVGSIAQRVYGPSSGVLQSLVKDYAQPVGQLFLRMIFMVVVPLLFSALVLGVTELGDARRVGKVGLRALGMTLLLSGTAVALALVAVNIVRPGAAIDPPSRERLMAQYGDRAGAKKSVDNASQAKSGIAALLEIVPDNPLKSATDALGGGLLPFMFFALVFGIAMAMVPEEHAVPLKALLGSIFQVTLKMIDFAMKLAPLGVFCLIFSTTAVLGLDALQALARYAFLVLGVLAIHFFISYGLCLRFIAKRNPFTFFKQIRTVIMTAFATSSSNATLPTALKSAVDDVGLSRETSSFVLTVGATANQNGTALFEGITVVFLAQLFGVELSLSQQITVMGLTILAGVGTAGVPGGSWPMIAIILMKVGVPAEAIGIVMGVDRLLDMSRTVLNVVGDMTIAACVEAMDKPQTAAEAGVS